NGLKSLHLSRRAYKASGDPLDLRRAAHAAEVVAQACVLRSDPASARRFLNLHRDMLQSLGQEPSPDVLRQMGVVAFLEEDFGTARKSLAAARRAWKDKVQHTGQMPDHEIPNFGPRQSNLLPPVNWDSAQETFDQALQLFPSGHIQQAMNLNWTAACGLATDSRSVQQQAVDLLEEHSEKVASYGHQSTIFRLLRITPALRPTLRPHWARRVLYANAFRDR
ncbi:MAG TPA: hypothetical protein VLV83_16880, partial [Acidobacteriota bacterium]|nr:hypothetical protein [Acidobacteriota bacterium]